MSDINTQSKPLVTSRRQQKLTTPEINTYAKQMQLCDKRRAKIPLHKNWGGVIPPPGTQAMPRLSDLMSTLSLAYWSHSRGPEQTLHTDKRSGQLQQQQRRRSHDVWPRHTPSVVPPVEEVTSSLSVQSIGKSGQGARKTSSEFMNDGRRTNVSPPFAQFQRPQKCVSPTPVTSDLSIGLLHRPYSDTNFQSQTGIENDSPVTRVPAWRRFHMSNRAPGDKASTQRKEPVVFEEDVGCPRVGSSISNDVLSINRLTPRHHRDQVKRNSHASDHQMTLNSPQTWVNKQSGDESGNIHQPMKADDRMESNSGGTEVGLTRRDSKETVSDPSLAHTTSVCTGQLRTHLEQTGHGQPVLKATPEAEAAMERERLNQVLARMGAGVSGRRLERLRHKAKQDYQMCRMKAESFCQQQGQTDFRTASADLDDFQLMEDDLKLQAWQDMHARNSQADLQADKHLTNVGSGQTGDAVNGKDDRCISNNDDEVFENPDSDGMSGLWRCPLSRREMRQRILAWAAEVDLALQKKICQEGRNKPKHNSLVTNWHTSNNINGVRQTGTDSVIYETTVTQPLSSRFP